MIDYSPFWKTLENSAENWYTLTTRHKLSHSTMSRLKNNKDISMKTVNDLCRILGCKIQDIAQYVPSEDDQPL
ncbi:DNA-binding Xre family transcriptional regulator [Catenibacillus scindens]|uniref:DNA-binding Xre family transcriptional regulator n=1 Tax=Catenibacillus scindens TaxID=673271 RepID=A0A7W8HBA0_9FIRM|nr:helix-turn-helix domain-containing protein [Catenibacillus scindens]MBB5265217.1 DNA-binding Xre family transcriptional regulator [Catenibacillus scindens]